MVHLENLPLLVIGVALAVLGITVVLAGPRARPNRWFGGFLLLVAANFLAGWLAWAAPAPGGGSNPRWFLVGHLLLLADAATLLRFTSIYPRRAWFGTAAGGSVIVVCASLLAGWALLDPDAATRAGSSPVRLATFACFAAAYLGALGLTIGNLAAAGYPATRRQRRVLVVGLLVAVAPRMGLLETDLGLASSANALPAVAVRLVVTWIVFGAAARAWWLGEPADERAAARPWLLAAGLFVAAVSLFWLGGLLVGPGRGYDVLLAFLYSGRWVFFGLVVLYAFARHRFLEIDLRPASGVRAGVALGLGVVVFLLLRSLTGPVEGHSALFPALPDALGAAGGVLAVAAAMTVRLPVPLLTRGAEPDLLRSRKFEAYRALLEATLESGRGPADPVLDDHRRRLGLSPGDHRDLLAIIETHQTVRRARGPEGALPSGYRLVRAFPSGETAWTVLAHPPEGGPPVVVKVLRPEWRAHERVRDAFRREGGLLARLRHPNVVRLLVLVEEPPALVLEHAAGGNLADRVASKGRLGAPELTRLASNLLEALKAIHGAGAIHRDVKPENVLLREDGSALLADLGIARDVPAGATRARLTAPGEAPGTVLYMAPEQVRGRPVDVRTDLYALGAVLVFAATGRHYLDAEGLGEFDVKRRIIESAPDLGDVPVTLRSLVGACLEKDAARRPPGAIGALRLVSGTSNP